MTGDKPKKKNSNDTPLDTSISIAWQAICETNLPRGDIAEVRTGQGKLRLFVAIHCLAGH